MMKLNALYVGVTDMKRSLDFYAVGACRYFQFRDEDGNWVELYETGE